MNERWKEDCLSNYWEMKHFDESWAKKCSELNEMTLAMENEEERDDYQNWVVDCFEKMQPEIV